MTPVTTTPTRRLTWAHLAALEPGLSELEVDCRELGAQDCTPDELMSLWCRYVKPELSVLVGWFRDTDDGPAVLFTAQAYAVAYAHLLGELGA
jgi:hypothetical protein